MDTTKHLALTKTKEKKRSTVTPARTLAAHAIEAALEKKAHDIVIMDMQRVSGVADFFVLCTGDVDLQIKAITDHIEDHLKKHCQERPWHIEGYEHLQWVLLDYVDVVVHVFSEEKRGFYDLERLWGDAPREVVPDNLTSASQIALLQEPAAKKSEA